MYRTNPYKRLFSALFFITILIFVPQISQSQETVYTLDNGMTVILKENHGSPMVTSMVFVKSGSKYESEYENGITHFLEHLLFDGTSNKSREEIDGSISDLGGYINAFTRKDMTAYLVLLPKQYIDYGMTVQADMLFNSLIPEEELPKERKVVIEEINRDKDSPGYAADKFFTEKAYAGTDYNRPVLGDKPFIENIPRKTIVQYWRKFYRPENMITLIIGDFKTDEMKKTVQNIFGSVHLTDSAKTVNTLTDYNPISGQQQFDTSANVQSTYINYSIEAPAYTSPDYLPLDLLCMYYGLDDISPLKKALKSGAEALASDVSIGMETYPEFSRISISVVANNPENISKIKEVIGNFFATASEYNADAESIAGIKTSVKAENIYNAEKLHYLGFMIGPMMMTAGYDFVQSYPERLDSVTWDDAKTAASRWLSNPNYIATTVRPTTEGDTPYIPYEMDETMITTFFDTATFADTLYTPIPLTYPSTDSVSFTIEDNAEYHREVFENGLTLIIKQNPTSRVFALNVIGKNRTVNEPEGKAGITDFVNRCIEKGTYTRDAAELSRDLTKIGANVTLYDNPWIPYDDRYTSRSYSFMKFETIDEFAQKGFNLFADMILYPSFKSDEVENIRNAMLGVLGRDAVNPGNVARNLFYENLFTNNKFANPVMGTSQSIAMITIDDLKSYHKKFYNPANMILSITTNKPIEEVQSWAAERFGRLQSLPAEYDTPQIPDPIFETKVAHTELDKEQIQIYIGSSMPGATDKDAAAISIASAILSDRLYLNLREKQGLAYSVGAGVRFDKDFGVNYSVIGSGAENYKTAVEGILLEIDKLKLDGPKIEELNKAKNQTWGRLMSAKLSSINQAYYIGLNEFYGYSVNHDAEYLSQLSEISIDDIRRVASKYFKTDNYVIATAGKKLE